MKFPALATVILFTIWLNLTLNRVSDADHKNRLAFWKRESESNSVRKKSLDGLNYIHIPIDDLPFGSLEKNITVLDCEKTIRDLSGESIVNLTGYTNTDLKLMYGTANITPLTAFDQNYTTLATTLNKWGKELFNNEKYKEAQKVLEFAVETHTDVTETYKLLCTMYQNNLNFSEEEISRKLKALLPVADSLNSLSRDTIVKLINTNITSLQ
ncbi:MAG: hypothetical protein K6A23_12335 [Butyrivibrio sp.]|nr:hypothetical protein [Butyrivibrio sp.]